VALSKDGFFAECQVLHSAKIFFKKRKRNSLLSAGLVTLGKEALFVECQDQHSLKNFSKKRKKFFA